MFPRPKPGDTEEDLLKFQKEFMANQEKPAVTVVKRPDKRKSSSSEDTQDSKPDNDRIGPNRDIVNMEVFPPEPQSVPPVKKSRFKSQQEKKIRRQKREAEMNLSPEERIDKTDSSTAAVLTKIIERDTKTSQVHLPRHANQAFPSVFRCDNPTQTKTASPGKTRSLFAQQFSTRGAGYFGVMLQQEEAKVSTTSASQASMETCVSGDAGPHLVEGRGLSATFGKDEARQIHQENTEKMTAMSEAEILQEQQKLIEMLDPKLVSFIKSKSKKENATPEFSIPPPQPLEKDKSQKDKSESLALGEDELPVKPDKKWINMDKAEYDKLSWMKELPPPKTGDTHTGQQARFDFKGQILHADLDLPVTSGLHHHGNEPERAGYTLEELFLLARSTNTQQRVIALNTLARIFSKARSGELSQLVQSAILPAVLDGGVVFLVRWAMDDKIDMVLSASVHALYNLLVNPADELALDQVFSWYQGHVIPEMNPSQNQSVPKEEDDENTVQETDADVLKRDVILCLVERMNLLPRIRFLLDQCRPQAPTVLHIIGILTRVVRHSTTVAYKVMLCPGLIEMVIREFLPTCWQDQVRDAPLSDLYGTPVPVVMKLMRALAQAGRHIAAHLISKHHLHKQLLRYLIADQPSHLQLADADCYQLQIESLRVLKLCLLYGLASETFIDLFPTFVKQLQQLQQDVTGESVSPQRMEQYVELVGVLEAAVHLAGTAVTANQKAAFVRSADGMSPETSKTETVAMPTVNWGHVADLLQPLISVLQKHLSEIKDTYQIKKQSLQLAVACINFVTSYYARWQSQVSVSAVVSLQSVEDYLSTVLEPCWSGFGFQVIFSNLSNHSQLLSRSKSPVLEITPSVPDLGCTELDDGQHPILTSGTPYGLVTAIMRQIYTLCSIHRGIQVMVLPWVLSHKDLWIYLQKTSVSTSHLHGNYFTKFENILHYFYLKLVIMSDLEQTQLNLSVIQRLTLTLLMRLHYGSEHIVHDILSTIVFSPSLWRLESDDRACGELADLKLSDTRHVTQVTQEDPAPQRELLQGCHTQLNTLRATYLKSFSDREQMVHKSRYCFTMIPLETDKFFTSRSGECLMPCDWMFVPLINLYNVFSSVGGDVQNALSVGQLDTVTAVLQWIYLLEVCQGDKMATISITLKMSRIMCVFLTGNDLFLDRTVHCYLEALLQRYTTPTLLNKLDFEEDIPGLVSFYDLYVALLQQYEAVSFGDSLFGCYLLLPLQQRHAIQLRRAVWVEYRGILRTLYLPVKELLIPIEGFLTPEESDLEMLRLYLEGLLSGSVQPRWCPVFYLTAVHHVNRFCYTQDGKHTQLKQNMLRDTFASQRTEVRQHLLFYKTADVSRNYGMELYDILPPLRQKLLVDIEKSLKKI
ncbi:RNA polymerase II-associated protein 1-like [Ylistrum balloti]|uniref:RNA polymerase II-associated protein 1-like n=1 Tax=Ylistrum balloti TaxID=509963 RepID=UPI002905BE50|nr:RNA polymerase II-associated protein 1-like [Ylistrum balloti]